MQMSSWQSQSFYLWVFSDVKLSITTFCEGEWLWHKSSFLRSSDRIKQLSVFISQRLGGKIPIFYFQSVRNKKRLMVPEIHWRGEIAQFLLEFWTVWEKRKMEGLEDFRFAVEGIGLVSAGSNLTITSSFHNFYLTLKLLLSDWRYFYFSLLLTIINSSWFILEHWCFEV